MNFYNSKNILICVLVLILISVIGQTFNIFGIINNLILIIVSYTLTIASLILLFFSIKLSDRPKINVSDSETLKKEIYIILNGYLKKGLTSIQNRLDTTTIKEKKIKSSIKIIEDGINKIDEINSNL